MPKSVATGIIDAALSAIALCDRMDVVSDTALPVDLSNTLANVALVPADFTISAGDGNPGSRKVTIAAKNGVAVTATGEANHIVLSQSGVIKVVTTCTPQQLTQGNQVNIPAFKDEIAEAV